MMITLADLADAEVRDLIAYHQRTMIEGSPPGLSFALDLSGLQLDDVTVWSAHVEGRPARSSGSMMRAAR
jgi:putative acetyltransferase